MCISQCILEGQLVGHTSSQVLHAIHTIIPSIINSHTMVHTFIMTCIYISSQTSPHMFSPVMLGLFIQQRCSTSMHSACRQWNLRTLENETSTKLIYVKQCCWWSVMTMPNLHLGLDETLNLVRPLLDPQLYYSSIPDAMPIPSPGLPCIFFLARSPV